MEHAGSFAGRGDWNGTHSNVAIIGAGPAGLTAALTLSEARNLSVVLLDAGRPHRRRYCPADHERPCNGCRGVCNVISGLGGAMHYGDGLKLSKFPSGRRLQEHLGAEASSALATSLRTLFPSLGCKPFKLPPPVFDALPIKPYPVLEVGASVLAAAIDDMARRLNDSPRVSLLQDTRVVDIQAKPAGGFLLRSTPRHRTSPIDIHADNVVVAVGRFGIEWWSRLAEELGLRMRPPTASIGVRFLCRPGLLRPAGEVHPDFKLSTTSRGRKVKSFCFCAGPMGGRLKFVDYGEHVLLDGHVSTEGVANSENFALLVQLRDQTGSPRGQSWIQENLLPRYRSLNHRHPGKPVVQSIEAFISDATETASADDLMARVGIRNVHPDLSPGRLSSLLDVDDRLAILDVLTSISAAVTATGGKMVRPEDFVVVGIELEGLWNEVEVSAHFESSIRGLYVAGDCAGLAQGVLQAATTGLVAAHGIVLRTG